MAAPAAAEVPVLAYLVVGLLAILGWAICRGLRGVWINTLGLMLVTLADVLKYDKAFIHIDFGGPIRALNNTILNAITVTGQKFEHSAGYFFHGAAIIQGWAARELVGLARDVLAWGQWLQHSHLPKWVKAAIYAALPPLLLARLAQAIAHGELNHAWRRVKVIERTLQPRITQVFKIAAAGAIPGILALPGLIKGVRDLKKWKADVNRRLRQLEKVGVGAGAVALFSAALAKLGLKWIRCRNVTKAGKAVCSTDGSLLESLLGDALIIASVISVVEFAKGLQSIEAEAVKILGFGIREFPG